VVRIPVILKARGLFHIYFLLDWSIEEGTFHVHLKQLKQVVSNIANNMRIDSSLATGAKVSSKSKPVTWCRRFETGGSLSRRVNVAACPSPDGSTRGRARRGEVRRPETGVREVGIPRPPCSSRAQVGCACSRGLQASTRERERAVSRERLSRPRPRAANPL
jgi:hypothetical protein